MKKSITIKAPQNEVWEALLSYRTAEPSKRKVISSTGEKTVMEEEFPGVPVVGSTRVVYCEVETPFERIDFRLVESKQVSVFEGAVTLAATKDGKSTVVEITTKLDSPLPIPFKDQVLSSQAGKDIEKRLEYLRKTAEKK
jgi:hypothetical protein